MQNRCHSYDRLIGGLLWPISADRRCFQRSRPIIVVIVVALGLISSACDNTVDPFTRDQEEYFVLYGYLDMAADTQMIRINPVTRTLGHQVDYSEITVGSTLLETAESVVWRDSLIELDDGDTGLLFYACFSPRPGGTYRIDVRGDEGLTTSAHTTVPETPMLTASEPDINVFGLISLQVVINEIWTPRKLGVQYRVIPIGSASTETHLITYHGLGYPGTQGWEIVVQLQRDFHTLLRDVYPSSDDTTMTFVSAGLVFDLLSEEWQDQEAELNIVNGHGFFGSIGRFYSELTLDSSTLLEIGYLIP